MGTTSSPARFEEFNLDPALAETVEAAPEQQVIEGILRLEDPGEIPPHFTVVSRFNRICTGRFPAGQTWTIRRHPNVISLKDARPLGTHDEGGSLADLVLPETGTPTGSAAPFTGRGCIVAALDFGLDFAHPNFLNPDGTTRLVAFWHQGAPYDPARPNRFGYGREYSQEEINAALRAPNPYQALGYHPAISDTGSGSHGTHTLDIAAGNGRAVGARAGGAPEADLIFVHLSTPRLGVVGDLGDSVRMLEALDYVDRMAQGRPWVVNLSVGRTAGSHDGTSLVEQGMHELLRLGPGRAIVQSAGNYRSADLAVHGWLRDGEERDLEWIIDPRDTTSNELDAWYSGKDRFVVAIRPPDEGDFVEARLGEVADLRHKGNLVGRVYHRKNDPNNRDNQVEVFLYRGAPPGTWTVRLIGDYVISGRFHAWIERDLARPGAQSRFDRKITSQSYTLGTIATSPLVITVGAYDANAVGTPLAPFSSCGPTRDERHDKPELLAPGVGVVAARSIPRGAVRQEGLLVARSGTSMAAPHVTGTVAAMFEAAGRPVSIDEIRDCLKRRAKPVTDGEHADCWAWGRLDTAEAVRRIRGLKEPELISAPRWDAFAPDPQVMTSDPAISDAATGDFASASEEQEIDVPLDEGALMNSDAAESFLDRAEHALRSSYGGRHELETSFLQQLLGELGGDLSAVAQSPAQLLRSVLYNRPLMQNARNVLEVLAMPSQRPQDPLRPGDWMLRAVPGAGDVGHVSVLASGDLLTQSMLASEGIAAESVQPGYYGLVIEAGAFPHSRSRPFARRVLDSRGRVSPHTVILRPKYPEVVSEPDCPVGEPEQEGGGGRIEVESSESEKADASDEYTPPAWLKIAERSRSHFRKIEERSRSQSGASESELSEGFTFEPTGAQTDFGPQLRKAWHRRIQKEFKKNLDLATGKIALGLSISDADAAKHVRFFSPASHAPSVTLSEANVLWRALPTRFGSPSSAIYKLLDDPDFQFDGTVQKSRLLRVQDEYCEWQVFRNGAKKIVRVVFSSEPPEYYDFLYEPGVSGLQTFARKLLVSLYQERCGTKAITLADLETTVGGTTVYDRGNKWNNQHCVHLQQTANTLGAQINIAARAAIIRSDAGGTLITNVKKLISCDDFGDPDRQSDPSIGDNVNKLARENRFLTLENPVGLYMTSLDTSGWKTPDGTDAQTFWKVLKGKTDKDPRKSMIVRAQYAVPADKGYTVSDIKIAGVPIEFGSQVAEHVEMRLGARFGPKDKDPEGAKTTAPTPVVC